MTDQASPEAVPSLYGIVVTYRRPAELRRMLGALATQTKELDRLLVVDNDPDRSAQEVVEILRVLKRIEYLAAGENLGPAGGIALGMEKLIPACRDTDWLVLLDDDDPPNPGDLLERVFSLATSGLPAVGGVGAVGSRFDLRRGRVVRVPDEELHGTVTVDVIAGNQYPMYRVAAIREVGYFDPTLFFGFEELDFCLRLREAGFDLVAHGEVFRHRRSRRPTPYVGTRLRLEEPNWRRYYSLRNLIWILRQRGHPLAAVRVTLLSGFLKPLANLPLTPGLALRNLRFNAGAARDAWRGRMGRTLDPAW